jgi:hypothetical protein
MIHRSLCVFVSAILQAANTANAYFLLSCLNSIYGGDPKVTAQDERPKEAKAFALL